MKTIDITPTWASLVPALIHILQHSESESSKHDIADELTKMARAADRWNAYCKEQNTIVRQEVGA
jgi:hypothetical protein